MPNIRVEIENELTSRGISYSTQAINALYQATINSSSETVGDSDSLLLGLLQCGSYTIDALIDAGVDTKHLHSIARSSTAYTLDEHECDPLEMLFSQYGVLGNFLNQYGGNNLETSDILEIAITPETLEGAYDCWFPKEISRSPSPTTSTLLEIENQVCYVIELCVDIISKKPDLTLKKRKKPFTTKEKESVIEELKYYTSRNSIEWAIHLTEKWFNEKILYLENYQTTLDIFDNVYGGLRLGASMFMESGGDFQALTIALKTAKRFAPEREDPLLCLVEREGKIFVKQFSYRNTARLKQDNTDSILSIGAEVILPLTSTYILEEFEEIINQEHIREHQIQKFLEAYPEILKSLGYASCKSQVILKEEGKNDLIPDFILQRPGNNGFDILDLKLPSVKATAKSPYPRISAEISKAIAQLRAYRNYFNNDINMSKFRKMYGMESLSPELIVVIGRSSEFTNFQERAEIIEQAKGVKIISYDELIEYGKSRTIVIP